MHKLLTANVELYCYRNVNYYYIRYLHTSLHYVVGKKLAKQVGVWSFSFGKPDHEHKIFPINDTRVVSSSFHFA